MTSGHWATSSAIITIADSHVRLCPATDAQFTQGGEDVVQTLDGVRRQIGYPKTIRVDNGSEFISRDLELWAYVNGVTLDFSRPDKPTDNAFKEAFKSKLLSECMNARWSISLADAREKLKTWRKHCTEDRHQGAIGYNVPIAMHYLGGNQPVAMAKPENSNIRRSIEGQRRAIKV